MGPLKKEDKRYNNQLDNYSDKYLNTFKLGFNTRGKKKQMILSYKGIAKDGLTISSISLGGTYSF